MFNKMTILLVAFFSVFVSYAQTEEATGEAVLEQTGFSDPEELVFDLIEKSSDFENWRKQDNFFTQLDNYFDFPYMARFVLGRAGKTIDETQLKEFINIFTELQVFNLMPHLKNSDSIKLVKKRSKNNKTALVFNYNPQNGSEPVEVIIFLKKNKQDDLVKIYDLTIIGVRMLLNWRTQIQSLIKRKGLEGLIQDLSDTLEKQKAKLD